MVFYGGQAVLSVIYPVIVALVSIRPFKPGRLVKPRDIPNLITLLRIVLAILIVRLLWQHQYDTALVLFIIAGLSDGLDGFLAKYYGWTSELGGMLDPLADKLLLMGSILMLGWQGDLPAWLVGLAVFRDVLIVSMAIAYHFLIEPFKAEPLLISKLNTLLQLLLVLLVISDAGLLDLPDELLTLLIYLTGLTTFASGATYVWEWSRRALHKGRRSHVS
jgi:cardiolipin synthase